MKYNSISEEVGAIRCVVLGATRNQDLTTVNKRLDGIIEKEKELQKMVIEFSDHICKQGRTIEKMAIEIYGKE